MIGKLDLEPNVRMALRWVAALAVIQMVLGIGAVISRVDMGIALLHQANALALFVLGDLHPAQASQPGCRARVIGTDCGRAGPYYNSSVSLGAMAELADAEDLKSSGGDTMWVRPPLAPLPMYAVHD